MSQAVFRHYDKRALDAEYNNRAKVKNAMEWMARYGGESARVRAELPMRFDVPYGAHHAERLDVFPAAGAAPAPIHVFVHGGYWHRLDKADFSYVARGLLPAGATVVVINYALIPTVQMAELVSQCRASIAWVHRHAASFGGDPRRIFVSGHSAGGHLVAMLMSTDWGSEGLPADVIKAGCGISGLYDLEPIRLCYLNDVLSLTPETARLHSPIHHPPSHAGPLLLPVGALEGPEYLRQSHALARVWSSRGLRCEAVEMAGHHHFSIIAELEEPASDLSRRLVRQMGLA